MSKEVEFWFDIVSPASYLAWTQMPKLAAETGATIRYKPFFLPGLFKAAGSASPITVPAKGKWLFHDLRRFARMYEVPFWMNDKFPLNSLNIMRGLIAFVDRPELVALGDGFFKAMWAENKDVTDPEVMAAIVTAAGVDPEEWMSAIQNDEIKQKVFSINEELARRGAFGAPTFFVREGEKEIMHWGQDRISFVKQALLSQS